MPISRRLGRIPLGMLATAAIIAAVPAASNADTPVSGCPAQAESQPFVPWLDYSEYVLAPGGSFESGTPSWALTGGAAVVGGNESYDLDGASDTQSLSLPDGSSATSPFFCVDLSDPTTRLMVRNTGSSSSTLKVSVVVQNAVGSTTLPVGSISAGSDWSPSPVIALLANVASLLSGNHVQVALQLTPQGSGGAWQVDDVFVDPWGRGGG